MHTHCLNLECQQAAHVNGLAMLCNSANGESPTRCLTVGAAHALVVGQWPAFGACLLVWAADPPGWGEAEACMCNRWTAGLPVGSSSRYQYKCERPNRRNRLQRASSVHSHQDLLSEHSGQHVLGSLGALQGTWSAASSENHWCNHNAFL